MKNSIFSRSAGFQPAITSRSAGFQPAPSSRHCEVRSNLTAILALALALLIATPSCSDYLDIVPDNMPTIDHAFSSRYEAECYLIGLFGYQPGFAGSGNTALATAGEAWSTWSNPNPFGWQTWNVVTGGWDANSPFNSAWDGGMFRGLRDINIFLENIHKPYDLEEWERIQWVAEVKFLKAFYHWWLFRYHGPIPLIKENVSLGEKGDQVQMYRQTVDECAEYIVQLLDEAAVDLVPRIADEARDLGRPTRAMCKALKAIVLTYMASPFWNCNPDWANWKDNRGVVLFPQDIAHGGTYTEEMRMAKWFRARDALKEAIDFAHDYKYELYDMRDAESTALYCRELSDTTIANYQIRGVVCERWNSEIIWGASGSSTGWLGQIGYPAFNDANWNGLAQSWAVPAHCVEQFYSKNGIPLNDDASWSGVNWYEDRIATWEDRQYIHVGDTVVNLMYDREPRFYGSITFQNSVFYGNGAKWDDNRDDAEELNYTNYVLRVTTARGSCTGYLCKKWIPHHVTIAENSGSLTWGETSSPFPVIRLSDLYLLYSEVLNECLDQPNEEVYYYIDKVRARYGLLGIREAYEKFAIESKKNYPKTKDNFRECIHTERDLELMFEGQRYYDYRRWKTAKKHFTSLAIRSYGYRKSAYDYEYNILLAATRRWTGYNYFCPNSVGTLLKNPNLLATPVDAEGAFD